MIKNRSFLMGLGIGITVGALILQLALIGQGATDSGKENALSRSELEQQAETLNLKVYEAEDEVMTEEEWTSKKLEGTASKDPKSDAATSSPAKPSSPQNEKPAEPQKPSTEDTSEPEGASEAVTYRVIQGATLNDVADHLSSLHVIQDREAFIKEANRQKINRKIQTGKYEFERNEATSSIIKKITSVQ